MSDRSELPILTDQEMLEVMRGDDNPLSRAWRMYRVETALIEQRARQGASVLKLRRMEMEAVMRIMRAAGIGIRLLDEERKVT